FKSSMCAKRSISLSYMTIPDLSSVSRDAESSERSARHCVLTALRSEDSASRLTKNQESAKRDVSGSRRGIEIQALDELAGVLGAEIAAHARVLPLHGQGTIVTDVVQGANDGFPIDAAVAGRAKVPTPSRVPQWKVGAEDAVFAV